MTALWQRIETSIGILPISKKLYIRPILRIAAAASIILLIGLGSIYKLNQVNIVAPLAERITCTMPDGSIIDLNAAGKISYNKLVWKIKRNLSLKGEAFFKVAKGEEFTVHCPTASVSVLGTSFNIYAQRDYFRTECYTGRVKVKVPREKFEKIIVPNEAVTAGINQKAKWTKLENTKSIPAWFAGEFYYDKIPFSLVLQEIENQFKVKFESKEFNENLLFTGYFNTKDLKKALEFVLVPMGYQYKINNNQIKIQKISTEN